MFKRRERGRERNNKAVFTLEGHAFVSQGHTFSRTDRFRGQTFLLELPRLVADVCATVLI